MTARNFYYTPIPFAQAKDYVLTFGKYKGKSVDAVASTDDGLRYLDWMRGALDLDHETQRAVCSYLDDEVVAADVAKLVGRAS